MRCGVGVPYTVLCRSGRGEEASGELNAGAEDSDERPPEQAPRSLAPGPVLGDFARRKTPKVSLAVRLLLISLIGEVFLYVCLFCLFLPLCDP